jgi:hypothetical protein
MRLTDKQNEIVQNLLERWGRPFITRDTNEIKEATGILYSAKSLANADSLKEGPDGKIRLGRKVIYPSENFFKWFVAKMEM